MKRSIAVFFLCIGLFVFANRVQAQTFPTDDPVLKAIWTEAVKNTQVYDLAQVLMDSIGPRLNGSPQHRAANEWAVARFESWGIAARNEQYGTWRNWRRGITHVDMLRPWVRSLEAMSLSWSPSTDGPVEVDLVLLPEFGTEAELQSWLPMASGKYVLISYPQPTCRPDYNWEEYATEESFDAMRSARRDAEQAWDQRVRAIGGERELVAHLESSGAAGVFKSRWPGNWGHMNISTSPSHNIPAVSLGCEDYSMLSRLVANDQSPLVRVNVESETLPEGPVYNTIAEMRGTELPEEYILLSAHLDSWDGGTGATDNGTGTVIMMETARIIKQLLPNPRRSIVVGLWGGEEQGLNGSRAFSEDHPEVVEGLQASFNQDNGTGRVARISMQGLTGAAGLFGKWLARVPSEITRHIDLFIPGTPGGGGSDYASFVCHGAPSFSLSSLSWEYRYTWHTQRDTFDKIVFDEVKNNVALTAMLVYLASEDPERMPREMRVMPVNQQTGERREWPDCRPASRAYERR